MSRAIFLKGSLKGHLWRQSYPAMLTALAMIGFTLADTFFIAQLGANQLAAMGFIFPIIEFVMGIGIGLGIGCSARAGNALGRHQLKRSNTFVGTACCLSLLVGLIITLIGLATISFVFHILGAHAVTLGFITAFMSIWYWTVPLTLTTFVMNFSMRVHAWAKLNACINIVGALINLALDPPLIFGWHFIPALGIKGAAIAGVIAKLIMLITCLFFLIKRQAIRLPSRFILFLRYVIKIIQIGIPAILTNMIPPISVTFATFLLAHMSQAAVAGYGIGTRIQWLAVIPLLCLSGALSPIVAQNYGANQFKRVKQALSLSLLTCFAWGFGICIILALAARFLTEFFTDNAHISIVSIHFLYIVPMSFFGWGMVMMLTSTLNAMAKPLYSTAISALRMLILFFPLAAFLMWWLGTNGVFFALSLSNILAALVGWLIVKRLFARCCTDD